MATPHVKENGYLAGYQFPAKIQGSVHLKEKMHTCWKASDLCCKFDCSFLILDLFEKANNDPNEWKNVALGENI